MKLSDAKGIPVTLTGQFKRHLPRYALGVLLLACYQGGQYWFDMQLMGAINAATGDGQKLLLTMGAALIALAFGLFFVRVLSRVVMFNAGRQAEYELRGALLSSLQELGPAFTQKMPVGEIMSRATNDLTQVRLLLGFGILNAVNTLFGLVSAFAVTMSISPRLTLASLAPIPLLLWVTRKFSSQLYIRQKENQEALGEMSDLVQMSITGARVVRSFDLEASQNARFDEKNESYLDKSLSLARLRGFMGPVMQSITSIGILIFFWYGGTLLVAGEIDAGGFLAFFRALGRLTWPLMALGFLVGLLQRGRAAYSRLLDIFESVPEITEREVVGQLGTSHAPVTGHLEVRGLTFSYPSEGDAPAPEVLSGVSFDLPEGASLAIMGRTGSGKSTLAQLLPRLLNTPRGAIFLDGQDVCDLPLSVLRAAIGYAKQDPFLFSTTAALNIGFALDEPEKHRDAILRAAKQAHVLDELLGLPDGLDTVVGERGVQLSGGQKQRVSLAGAFVLGPELLVLDDPLSAVDAKTEKGILEAIDEQRSARGVILITHRVAAARRCDRIIVLSEGRVVEEGTHDELCKNGGLYASFAEEQRIESELDALSHQEFVQQELGSSPAQPMSPEGATP